MNTMPEPGSELLPPTPIRVETALSRYPVHRLARHGDIAIDIRERDDNGEVSIKWEVDYSKKHGQPGPLAYKLDTLIINRRIEEAARPLPRIIRLGSLRDICRELGQTEGENVNTIRKALRQNAFAGITARIRYRQNDGGERTLEADFTRYSVIFTGEELPNGRKADSVYIVLNDVFMKVINGAMTRPLDYDYIRSLPPAPQRFYELLSYQMYAAIKNDRPRAKLVYSEFCTYAPQTRHFDWDRVRSQMNKIYRPHKESGYVTRIDYEQTFDGDGQPDWLMFYQPGPKARAEYRAFTKRGGPVMLEVEPSATEFPALAAPQQQALPLDESEPEPSPFVAELVRRGVTKATAEELVRQHPAERIADKIEVFDWLQTTKDKRVQKSPAGYLAQSIRDDYATPKGFESKAERAKREAEATVAKRQAEARAQQERADKARSQAEDEAIDRYWAGLTPQQQTSLDEAARALADPATLAGEISPALKRMGTAIRRREHIRCILQE